MESRILVVEDDREHAELIRRAFELHGGFQHLTVAQTLATARVAMADDIPDLVLADLVLPDGQGIDLISRGSRENRLPIVIMTAQGDEEAAVEALKAGALHYVVKSSMTLAELPQIAEGALREWRHVVERWRAEAALQASERRYRSLYDDTPAMFFTVDADGFILSANRFAAKLLGRSVEQLRLRRFDELCVEGERDAVRQHLRECFDNPDGQSRWETCHERSGGELIWVRTTARTVRDDQERLTALMVCEDITEAYRLSRKLSYQASHDSLTSLYNRREFEFRLGRALEEALEEGATHAICYLDLDHFKVINDSCGHLAGDKLLCQLGALLQRRIRKGDTLARLGGDEFGVLLRHCTWDDALHVAKSLRQWISDFRFVCEDQVFNIGVSIGVVPISGAIGTVTSALGAADRACYAAKEKGSNRIHFYQEEDTELVKRRGEMRWVLRIRRALEENRFRLSYQPIVPVNGHDPGLHYEVLIRMIDENGDPVGADAFLPAAERFNLIGRLDRWVVETTFQWLVRHPRHLRRLRLCSINLSAKSLGDSAFLAFITRQFSQTGVPPEKICFEITETMAIANIARASRFIYSLKKLGCRFALDDFGSGLSSFAYLKTLSVDFLKIDGVFVKDIVDDPINAALVSSINEIGHVMGKKTIAEWVENAATLDKLRTIGVDFAQGHGLGRPEPLAELA